MATCGLCGATFMNAYQLGPHKVACRNLISGSFLTAPDKDSELSNSDDDNDDGDDDVVASEPPTTTSLVDLAQRANRGNRFKIRVTPNVSVQPSKSFCFDFHSMQKTWSTYITKVGNLCSPHFWDMFSKVHQQTAACADKVLHHVHKLLKNNTTLRLGHRWPTSTRSLRQRVVSKAGWFWDNVTQYHSIDLSPFGPFGKIKFTFVDPIFVWIQQCVKLASHGHVLVWEPHVLRDPKTGHAMYGAGIEYSLLLRAAQTTIPAEARVALINLSWDGGNTGFGSRSAAPICVQVMNTNSGHKFGVGLVGYTPVIQVSKAIQSTKAYEQASHYLRQECIARIVQCIERRSQHGFLCCVDGRVRWYFPRLGAMSLDTKERQAYFGLRSVRTCGTCRLRNGRSVCRRARRQDPDVIRLYFNWATSHTRTAVGISQRARARASLERHGFQYKFRCRLCDVANACLVHIPQFPKTAFAGLCQFERMHTFYIAYCDYLTELLVACVQKDMKVKVHEYVRACHQFRDPVSGRIHPRLSQLLKTTHLTAERRVRSIFYWGHVLGTKATVIVEEMRTPAMAAVSTLQLVLIATRGHRAYTQKELKIIFHETGGEFFRNIEILASYGDSKRMERGMQEHRRDPDKHLPPVPYKRLKRYSSVKHKIMRTQTQISFFKTQMRLSHYKFAFQNTNPNFTMHAQNTNPPFKTQMRLSHYKFAFQNTNPNFTIHAQNTNPPFKTRIRLFILQIRLSKHKSEFYDSSYMHKTQILLSKREYVFSYGPNQNVGVLGSPTQRIRTTTSDGEGLGFLNILGKGCPTR